MIVDPEFGALGDPGRGGCLDFIRTEMDNSVDSASLLPGKYTFEKFIGGNFLGEIARYKHKHDICLRNIPVSPKVLHQSVNSLSVVLKTKE